MVEFISLYPFVIALLAAALAELSAILIRRVAPTVGKWLWGLAGLLSVLSAAGLVWSFFWAATYSSPSSPPPVFAQVIGLLLAVSGVALLAWAVISLARQTLYAGPMTRLITKGPYSYLRRPMGAAIGLIALGLALLNNDQANWIWLLVWVVISLALFELEEWELKMRLPGAAEYLSRTPRYLPRFKIRLRK